MSKIVLAGGCFWCLEAVFLKVIGVLNIVSGYANGDIENPNYKIVSSGKSGFAECVEVEFDENIISLIDLLEIFFAIHDPTTLNKQGADIGTQYRSAIFYLDDEQLVDIVDFISKLKNSFIYEIVTEIEPLINFYKAEDYHQNYYENNKNQSYCSFVIAPKVDKFYKEFQKLSKDVK